MLIIDFGPKERAVSKKEGRTWGEVTTARQIGEDRKPPVSFSTAEIQRLELRALSLSVSPEIPSNCRYREFVNSIHSCLYVWGVDCLSNIKVIFVSFSLQVLRRFYVFENNCSGVWLFRIIKVGSLSFFLQRTSQTQ